MPARACLLIVALIIFVPHDLWSEEGPNDASGSCGSSALYLLLRSHNVDVSLAEIENRVPLRVDGNSLRELMAVSDEFGLPLRAVRLSFEDLPNIDGAFIAWLQDLGQSGQNHYVVIRSVGKRGKQMQILDPPIAPVLVDAASVFATTRDQRLVALLPQRESFHLWAITALTGLVVIVVLWFVAQWPHRQNA